MYLKVRQAKKAQDKEEIKELRALIDQLQDQNHVQGMQIEQLNQKVAEYVHNHDDVPSSSASGGHSDGHDAARGTFFGIWLEDVICFDTVYIGTEWMRHVWMYFNGLYILVWFVWMFGWLQTWFVLYILMFMHFILVICVVIGIYVSNICGIGWKFIENEMNWK